MTEEEIARCFQIPNYRDHPELTIQDGDGHAFICDARHAAAFYVNGWNERVRGQPMSQNRYFHPAAERAHEMGYADAEGETECIEPPSLL